MAERTSRTTTTKAAGTVSDETSGAEAAKAAEQAEAEAARAAAEEQAARDEAERVQNSREGDADREPIEHFVTNGRALLGEEPGIVRAAFVGLGRATLSLDEARAAVDHYKTRPAELDTGAAADQE